MSFLSDDEFSGLESLFNTPNGSTNKNSAGPVPKKKPKSDKRQVEVVTAGFTDKTKQLTTLSNRIDYMMELDDTEKLKYNITVEQLESDRQEIMFEAFQTQKMAKSILKKVYTDLRDGGALDPSIIDAISKLINTVSSCERNLSDLNTRYRQEEDMKLMEVLGEEDDEKTISLSGSQFMDIINEFNKDEKARIESAQVVEAIDIIEGNEEHE